jgi:hypothetical protein
MFANPTKVGISQRVVATLVASAMVLWTLGVHFTAQAADLSNISATISDSAPSATASTTIQFTVPTGSSIAGGNNITVTFDSQDDGAGGQDFAGGDISGVISSNANLLAATNGGSYSAPTFVTSDNDSFTISGLTATAGQIVEIQVASGVVSNSSTVDSYEIQVDVANATNDSGRTRIAIVDTVEVSASVATVFDFLVTGLATSTAQNGTTTTGSSSDVALNFGQLVAGGQYNLAQQLNVTTNARNGFVVTVESDSELESGNGAIIDSFADGSQVGDTGTSWASPTASIADDTTWGHWGFRSDDGDLNSLGGFYSGEFGADEYIAMSSTTPQEVFHHDGPISGGRGGSPKIIASSLPPSSVSSAGVGSGVGVGVGVVAAATV